MANTTFKLRRSSVAGKTPNTSTISIGELAINLTDRKLYSSDGSAVFETGSNLTSLSVFSDVRVGNSSVNTVVNSTSLSIGSNALVNTSTLSIGNSTVNTVVNSTSISVKSIVANGGVGSANQILISNGTGIYWGVFPGGTQLIKQQYTANGSQTDFTVTGGYYSNNLQVYLNGVLLRNGIDANVESGNTFTISPAPANGSLIDVYGISSLYANGVSSIVSQQFTANGSSNTFTVTNGYLPNQILVFLNGVKQIPGTDVTITSGNTVNFVSTPANGYIVDVYGYQTSVSYYSNNLVIGNVSIGTSTISVGNSSVNTQIIAGNVFLNGSTLVVGNTAANVTVNNTVLSVGSNVSVSASTLSIGNSTVNTVANSTTFAINGNNISPVQSFRNKIINGHIVFDQRNGGANTTVSTNNGVYTCDRWWTQVAANTTGAIVAQTTDAPTEFNYSLKVQRVSGNTGTSTITVGQVIESNNCFDLQGKIITLSFYGKAGANLSNSSIGVTVKTGTTSDEGMAKYANNTWAGTSNVISTTQTVTTSWTKYTFTTSAALGSTIKELGVSFQFTPTGTAGTNDWFEITGVQLEAGSVATPFEMRPIGMEMLLCQRYYEKSYNITVNPGTVSYAGTNFFYFTGASGQVSGGMSIPFKVQKRNTPSVTTYSPASGASGQIRDDNFGQDIVPAVDHIGTSGFRFYVSSYGSAGSSNFTFQWVANAEF